MKICFKDVESRAVIHEVKITLELEMPNPHSMVCIAGIDYIAVAMKRCYIKDDIILEVLLATEEQYPKYIPRQEEH